MGTYSSKTVQYVLTILAPKSYFALPLLRSSECSTQVDGFSSSSPKMTDSHPATQGPCLYSIESPSPLQTALCHLPNLSLKFYSIWHFNVFCILMYFGYFRYAQQKLRISFRRKSCVCYMYVSIVYFE